MHSGGAAAAPQPVAAEAATQKRDTDCIYFLASPSTCKKGSECEYRHSEGARMNPRDCWFWLNGNCLNPKCSFRHPPLDGFYDPSTPVMPSVPIPGYITTYNTNKKPCHFFKRGNCLNGDSCQYLHAIPTAGNNHTEQGPKVPALSSIQAVETTPQKTLIHRASLSSLDKPKVSDARLAMNSGDPSVNGLHAESFSGHATSSPLGYRVANNVQPEMEATQEEDTRPDFRHNSLPSDSVLELVCDQNGEAPDDQQENSREGDEFCIENSPGFDVLVDCVNNEPRYMHDEAEFGRVGRDMYPVDDIEYGHVHYDIPAHHEREKYRELAEPDRLRMPFDLYGRKRRRMSLERFMDSSMLPDARYLPRESDYAEIDRSDLRHLLSKNRRRNYSRSSLSPDTGADWNMRDEHYMDEQKMNVSRTVVSLAHRGDWYTRDGHVEERLGNHHSHIYNGNLHANYESSHLQGRINLPGRSDSSDLHTEREMDRRRYRGSRSFRKSPDSYSRYQDRIKRRSSDLAPTRILSSQVVKKDFDPEFGSPKRLSGITKGNNGSAKFDGSLDFEGPKSLSEILKMKKDALTSSGGTLTKDNCGSAAGLRIDLVASLSSEEQRVAQEADVCIAEDDAEDGIHVDVGGDEQESDKHEAKNWYFDNEAKDCNGKKNEGNTYQEDEGEFGDDDEDDFAQKVGTMFS